MSRSAPDPSSRLPRSATASPSARTVSLFVPSRLARQRRALGRQPCCPSRPILTAPRSHFSLSQGKFAMIKDCVVIADGTIVPDYAVLAPFSHVAGAPGPSPPCRASLLVTKVVTKAHERLTSLLPSQAGGLATYPNRPKKRRSPARRATMLASEPRPPRTGRRQTARRRRPRARARWRCRGNRRALAPKDGRSDAEKEGEGVGARDSGVWRELE
jgi:hypothetical protein